jgi:1-acyl-sn-glycerol-3-phosphate acyltransferase
MGFWYGLAKAILGAYLTAFAEVIHLRGEERMPAGAKIIVPNHPNATDAFVLPFIIPERLHFLVLEETFGLPIVGRLLALADQIPLTLGQGRKALDIARDRLAHRDVIVIFPEGYMSRPNRLRRGCAGAVLVALQTGAPLVPVGFYVPPPFIHTLRAHVFGRETVGRWQMGGRCFVQIGAPWQISPSAQSSRSYRVLRRLTDELMVRIAGVAQQAKEEAFR